MDMEVDCLKMDEVKTFVRQEVLFLQVEEKQCVRSWRT